MDRLLNMIFRLVMKQGMSRGMRALSQRGQPQDDTPEDRKARRDAPKPPSQLGNASKLMRRFMRF